MPSVSKDQAAMMRVAEHAPEKLYARNRGALKMGKAELHKFAATRSKGLPQRAKH
jgi:hypothetical protein